MRDRFATIGIGPDGDFDPAKLSDEQRTAIEGGMADAWAELHTFQTEQLQTGKVTSGQLFGSAEQLGGNYLYRFAGAVMGILGLPGAEARYFPLTNDSTGAKLSGVNNYTLTFPAGQLPPVKAFWSVTMYKLPQILLVWIIWKFRKKQDGRAPATFTGNHRLEILWTAIPVVALVIVSVPADPFGTNRMRASS